MQEYEERNAAEVLELSELIKNSNFPFDLFIEDNSLLAKLPIIENSPTLKKLLEIHRPGLLKKMQENYRESAPYSIENNPEYRDPKIRLKDIHTATGLTDSIYKRYRTVKPEEPSSDRPEELSNSDKPEKPSSEKYNIPSSPQTLTTPKYRTLIHNAYAFNKDGTPILEDIPKPSWYERPVKAPKEHEEHDKNLPAQALKKEAELQAKKKEDSRPERDTTSPVQTATPTKKQEKMGFSYFKDGSDVGNYKESDFTYKTPHVNPFKGYIPFYRQSAAWGMLL